MNVMKLMNEWMDEMNKFLDLRNAKGRGLLVYVSILVPTYLGTWVGMYIHHA